DVSTGAATRFGRPAVWAAYGMAHGINAGDAMCALSYLTLLVPDGPRAPERTVGMTRRLHQATLEMCAGQSRMSASGAEPRVDPLVDAARELGALAASAA
ncbi:MAG: hypothetical protein ABR591_02580, partial [Candidatus Velthaea sp.]